MIVNENHPEQDSSERSLNVLQVNVRLSEGGAAGVARTLSDEIRSGGGESKFAYGHGRRGLASPLEAAYEGIRVTPGVVGAINRTAHAYLGAETELRSPRLWREFEAQIDRADVVHLHAIHSFFLSPKTLLRTLVEARKPVVWTLHDQWIMTGRCAQPGACRTWEKGCSACPDLTAYPPARFDHAAVRWVQRRQQIEELQASVPVAIVACAKWLGEEASLAGFSDVEIIPNSVDPEFWRSTRKINSSAKSGDILFVCRDLRDPNKVDVDFLRKVAQLTDRRLTVIGDHSPGFGAGAVVKGAIADRAALAAEMLAHRVLVFTSEVDYFPLTITEALTAGLSVYAIRSRAAEEFETDPRVFLFENTAQLIDALSHAEPPRNAPSDAVLNQFAPKRMTNSYMTTYRRLLAETQ